MHQGMGTMQQGVSRDGKVCVTWDYIGEGLSGDYIPSDPNDVALMRFDTELLIDGQWEEMEDGSYCTQVPYETDPETLVVLAKMIANEIADHPGRKTCERMSWIDPTWAHRFQIDPLEGPSAVEEFARDLFGTDTTVGIRDTQVGGIILYCHESLAQKMVTLLENGENG